MSKITPAFLDSLTNLLSGMGTSSDKITFTRYALISLTTAQLEAAYRSDWIARKVIDIPAFDATREWRAWQAEKDAITKLEEAEKGFALQPKLLLALQRARLYGGGALILGLDQGKEDEPVDLEAVKQGSLKYIHAVSRFEITAGDVEMDIRSPYYGEPKYYESRSTAANIRLHPSRVVRLIGAPILDVQQSNGWGDSILQIVNDAIVATGVVAGGIAALVQEAKIDVIKIPGLMDQISVKEYEERLKKRFGLASDAKSIYKMLLLDKEEEWERITANFSGMPDVLKVYLLIASGAADIPATRMLGQSPAGLSATGESDTRNYYDRVHTEQRVILTPALTRMDEVLIRSALGTRPPEIFYEWNSLWQLDETQKAEIASKKANAFKIDVDAALIPGDVLREARVNQLIEDGTYPGLETIIEEFEAEGGDMAETAAEEAAQAAANAPGQPGEGEDPNASPKPGAGKEETTADRMTRRIRVRPARSVANVKDAKPRTLYVRRDVLNAQDIIDWAKGQGFKKTVPAKEMHVTVCFSRQPVDWIKVSQYEPWGQDERGRMKIVPGGARLVERMGPTQEAAVLLFTSSALTYRHCDLRREGATWEYEDYQPHITIIYEGAPKNLDKVEPYRGEIILGPEIFEEVKADYRQGLEEE